ncbi:hypothetical protein [Yinghuangia soli]|uniref:Uncharacterized protein n=1 Tax=Yinghuangia soli TaxID=2908204 RepID=A0AA41PXC6_9ACTN|nr:hypothetical protein [Yinghuangia soli]MCF2526569.1 hypothetical protein [Yinghuangia soli]
MSAPGSGGRPKPRLGGLGGRLGGKRKPAAAPAPRTGWKPKGTPQSGGSAGGGSGGPAGPRRVPPSRTTPGQGGGPARRPGATGGKPGTGGGSSERRRSPRQFLPGGARRETDAGTDPQDGADGGTNTRPGTPASGGGGGGGWTGLGYTAVDYFMMLPGFAVAWYGGQLVQECAVEAGGKAAFALWFMIGFWVVLATARWPSFRMLRWAWVLAGVLGAFAVPG